MAGNPRAVRAVGGAMRRNPVSVDDIDWQASFLLTLFSHKGKLIVFYIVFLADFNGYCKLIYCVWTTGKPIIKSELVAL